MAGEITTLKFFSVYHKIYFSLFKRLQKLLCDLKHILKHATNVMYIAIIYVVCSEQFLILAKFSNEREISSIGVIWI